LDGLRKNQDKMLYENLELKNTVKTVQTSAVTQLENYVIEDQSIKLIYLKTMSLIFCDLRLKKA